jgi:hypothetical protein
LLGLSSPASRGAFAGSRRGSSSKGHLAPPAASQPPPTSVKIYRFWRCLFLQHLLCLCYHI